MQDERDRKRTSKQISLFMAIAIAIILTYLLAYSFAMDSSSILNGFEDAMQNISSGKLLFKPTRQSTWGLIVGIVIGGVAFFFFEIDTQRHAHYQDDATSGTGGFMTKADMKEYNDKYIKADPPAIKKNLPVSYDPKKDEDKYSPNIIMSEHFRRPINSRALIGNNNILVVGGAGTGKSRFFVKPNILQMNASYIITDPSGEMIYSLGKVLSDHGYKIRVFNISDMDHSNCYNPFSYIRDEAGVNMLIECLINNTTAGSVSGGNQFFVDAEKLLYAACIYYMREFGQKSDIKNFAGVLKMINASSVDESNPNAQSPLDRLFSGLPHDSLAWMHYKAFKQAAGKTLKSIIISCVVRMRPFFTPQVDRLTSTDELELEKLGDEKTALFIITPQADRTYSFLASILYSQAFETLYYRAEQKKAVTGNERLDVPVCCIMDEFANIGEVPEFPSKLATMRKYNISATVILQDISQIESMYKDDWKTLVGNCSTLIFLGAQELNTLKYFSEKLGKTTIRARSNSDQKGSAGHSSNSYQNTGREVMTEEELGRMPSDECVVYTQNMRPVRDKKFNYENHIYYDQTADADEGNAFMYTRMSAFDTKRAGKSRGFLRAREEGARIRSKSIEERCRPIKEEEVVFNDSPENIADNISFGEEEDKAVFRENVHDSILALVDQSYNTYEYPIPYVNLEMFPPKKLESLANSISAQSGLDKFIIFDDINSDSPTIPGLAFGAEMTNLERVINTKYTKAFETDNNCIKFIIRKSVFEEFINEVNANIEADEEDEED